MTRHFFSLKSRIGGNARSSVAAATLHPRDVARLYGLEPLYGQGFYGQGQAVGFIEFATPVAQDDADFWAAESMSPGLNTPVRTVVIGQATSDSSATVETDLDVQYAGALAPGASLTAYLISDQGSLESFLGGVYDALYQAAQDGVKIVSISLGTADTIFAQAGPITSQLTGQTWPDPATFAQALDQLIATQGMAVFAAAGDSGAYGGLSFYDFQPQPIWPATQGGIIAVGGTQLVAPGRLASGEEAWGGQTFLPILPGYSAGNTLPQASGGGGVSALLPAPSYQADLGLAGRATPDIAAFAGPLTIIQRGQSLSVWGTSASAPIAAAVTALIGQATGRLLGHADLYARATDIKAGNDWNDELLLFMLDTYHVAGAGYDLCTGMGTPVATAWVGAPTAAATGSPDEAGAPSGGGGVPDAGASGGAGPADDRIDGANSVDAATAGEGVAGATTAG